MARDGGGIAATGAGRRRSVMTGRSGHVRAAVLSAPVAALLLVALVAVGAVDFLGRDKRTDQIPATAQRELVVDGDGHGSAAENSEQEANGNSESERQIGAAPGAVAAFLVAAAALVVVLFAAAGLAVLLFAGILWAAMRKTRPVTKR